MIYEKAFLLSYMYLVSESLLGLVKSNDLDILLGC